MCCDLLHMLKQDKKFAILKKGSIIMSNKQQKIFEPFLEKVAEFPFWIKEIIYIKIREEFEQAYLSDADLNTPIEETYQAFTPKLTFCGEQELETHEREEDAPIYRFLQNCADGCSLAEITLRNFWTLESTAKIHLYCLQKEYVNKPTSAKISSTALYISGRIKMGEYFRRIGKISTDELNAAVKKQKELEAQGQQVHFAEVLIQLGYITEQETKAIIYLKDECKKRFIFNSNGMGRQTEESAHSSSSPSLVNSELKDLRKQVCDLRVKLDKIRKIADE